METKITLTKDLGAGHYLGNLSQGRDDLMISTPIYITEKQPYLCFTFPRVLEAGEKEMFFENYRDVVSNLIEEKENLTRLINSITLLMQKQVDFGKLIMVQVDKAVIYLIPINDAMVI